MSNYYGNRLVKFVSPQCDRMFSLELGGNEEELKDLIATILNISITELKGIKDSHNNYYTFSSAIKNQNLTNSHSEYYTIVLGNGFNSNQQIKIQPWSLNTLSNNGNSALDSNKKKAKTIINQQAVKQEQLLKQLVTGKFIDIKHIPKIQNMLADETNDDLISLFNSYNCYDLKIFNEKLHSIINIDSEKNSNKSQNICYIDVLDSIEDHFEDKKDLKLLKQLLSFDNELVLKAFETYEDNSDVLLLVDTLNQILKKYKTKIGDIVDLPSEDTERNNNQFSNRVKQQNREALINNNYNILLLKLSFEYKAIIAYAKASNPKYPQLFELEKDFTDLNCVKQSINSVKLYYDDFIQKNVLNNFTKEQKDKFEKIITDESQNKAIKQAFESFQQSFNIDQLKNDIEKYIQTLLIQNRNSTKKRQSRPSIKPNPIEKKETKEKDIFVIKNNDKEKKTITLKYQNSINSVSNQNAQKEKKEQSSKRNSENFQADSFGNKKVKDFIKVINTLSFDEQSKAKILQLLSEKDEKMVKIFDNYQKNKMSLTKNVLLNAIKDSNPKERTMNNNTNKNKDNKSNSNSNSTRRDVPTGSTSFNEVIAYLEQEKIISLGESAFLKKRFQNNDEMLLSFWEVYKLSNGELQDFIDSLKTFIGKHHAKNVDSPDLVGSKTPISITKTRKDLINLIRSNEKSELEKIKNKQKKLISLLAKYNLMESKYQTFFNMKIEEEDPMLTSVFEVFSVIKDHRDFVETLNLVKEIMYNKESNSEDPDPMTHHLKVLNELLQKSKFTDFEKELLRTNLQKSNQTILSALELYEIESDVDEALDTLEISVMKLNKK